MKCGRGGGLTLKHRLQNFLLTYRTTPHSTTGTAPCELLMGRSLRTRWDLLRPDTNRRVRQSQARQKETHDERARLRTFEVGDKVVVKNFGSGPNWLCGTIAMKCGPLTYLVNVTDGRVWKRHVDHIKTCQTTQSAPEVETEVEGDFDLPQTPREVSISGPASTEVTNSSNDDSSVPPSNEGTQPTVPPNSQTPRRYPSRQHNPPDRFEPNNL